MGEASHELEPTRRMRARAALGAVAFVACLLATLHARAEDATRSPVPALSPAAAAPAEPEEPGAALYKQAEASYLEGDVAGALALMQESYEVSGRPELLYNIGELQRELHRCLEARTSYERYLALARSGTQRHEAERHQQELARQCPDTASPATVPPPDARPDRYWTPMRIAAWSTLGGAVVFAATATYFAVRAANANSQVN